MIITPKGLIIKKCSHGRGLFAKRFFRKGQVISEIIGGQIVKKSSEASMYALKIQDKNLWWDEIDIKRPEWDSFIDHAENQNAEILFTSLSLKNLKAKLVALRNIRANEEITINYHNYGDRLVKWNKQG